MKRAKFIQKAGVIGLVPAVGLTACATTEPDYTENVLDVAELKKELTAAWERSELMTLTNMEQMPPEYFTFKYTEEAMTFSEQWRHCVVYTCGQLASRAGLVNTYEDIKLPVQMPKDEVIGEVKKMYSFVRQSIERLSAETLMSKSDFAGDEIPVWRLIYALENRR